jgi:hypothetical protein
VKSSGREAHLGRLSQPPSSETLGVATVMLDSKRRPASTQAVSRKVEGIEPRNQVNRKDDGVRMHGSRYRHHRLGEGMTASSGSETMACVTLGLHGNPGDPDAAFGRTTQCSKRSETESMPNNRTRGGRQTSGRESDRLIVPAKAGNAAGGKEATDGRAE